MSVAGVPGDFDGLRAGLLGLRQTFGSVRVGGAWRRQ